MTRVQRMLVALAASAALLAGCASGVKLDEGAQVVDRTATPVGSGTGDGATSSATAQSRVAPVAADPSAGSTTGPAGTGRLVYFDYDSFVIKPEFQAVIEAHARFLKANAGRKIAIEGHTDERGGREYNLALGQKRAEAVRRALGLLGVTDSQMEAVSFGKEKPANTASTEAAFAENRRAEIVYR